MSSARVCACVLMYARVLIAACVAGVAQGAELEISPTARPLCHGHAPTPPHLPLMDCYGNPPVPLFQTSLQSPLHSPPPPQVVSRGFTPIMTPDLVKASVLEKCGFQPRGSGTQVRGGGWHGGEGRHERHGRSGLGRGCRQRCRPHAGPVGRCATAAPTQPCVGVREAENALQTVRQ